MTERIETDEPRMADGDDEALAQFWKPLAVVLTIGVAVGGFYGYQWLKEDQLASEAAQAFFEAETPEDWESVADQFAGTSAGAESLVKLAAAHRETGDWEKAVAAYDRFVRSYPEHSLTGMMQLAKARVLAEAGELDEAEKAFQLIVETDTRKVLMGPALMGIARIEVKRGDIPKARGALRRVIEEGSLRFDVMMAEREMLQLPREVPKEPAAKAPEAPEASDAK